MLLKHITGQPVQPNKAIVGRNAFAHESGIHQHGYLAHRETYEIMRPEDIGLSESQIILGKHSGRLCIALKIISKKWDTDLDDEQLNDVLESLKHSQTKKIIEDADLDAILMENWEKKKQDIH